MYPPFDLALACKVSQVPGNEATYRICTIRIIFCDMILSVCCAPCVQGLQGAIKNASFTKSPVATMEDLCTTHERQYVERYFDGLFTDVRCRTYDEEGRESGSDQTSEDMP